MISKAKLTQAMPDTYTNPGVGYECQHSEKGRKNQEFVTNYSGYLLSFAISHTPLNCRKVNVTCKPRREERTIICTISHTH
ncbi:hypothetical protein J6590_019956 [Homalodisca vitripennis]|nr:hypothetical protein J6590_019956 [Homalodisca vitripennis]